MIVANNGNVGIGTLNTNRSGLGVDHTVLTVGADAGMGMLELQGTRTSDADLGRIAWLNAGTRQSEIVASRIDDNTSTKMSFRTSNAGSLSTKMTIAKDGNVGIGETSPSTKTEIKQTNNDIFQLTLYNNHLSTTAKTRIGNWTDLVKISSNFMQSGGTKTQDNTAKSSWVQSMGDDSFDISRSPAGSTTLSSLMNISSEGDIGFNTTFADPDADCLFIEAQDNYALYSGSDGTGGSNHIVFGNANSWIGTITTNGSTTTYSTTSDYRLKEDLQNFAGLDMVSKIPVYDFKWKTDESRSYGVMAHELQEVLPDAVVGEKDAEEMQSVDYSKIVPLLVKSIQELTAKVEMLEKNCQCKN